MTGEASLERRLNALRAVTPIPRSTVHGVVFDFFCWRPNPFDSCPILIRLRAVPNFKEPVIETPLVRQHKTPSSAIKHTSREMWRERNGTQSGVSDSAAIRSRLVPKLKKPGKSVAK